MSNLEPIKLHNDRVQIDPKKNEHIVQLSPARQHSEIAMGDEDNNDQNNREDEEEKKQAEEEKRKSGFTPRMPRSRRRGGQPAQTAQNVGPAPANSQPPPAQTATNNQPFGSNSPAGPAQATPAAPKSREEVLAEMKRIQALNADKITNAQSGNAVSSSNQPTRGGSSGDQNKRPPAQPSKFTRLPGWGTYSGLVNEANKVEDDDRYSDDADKVDYDDSPIEEGLQSNQPSAPIAAAGSSMPVASATDGEEGISETGTVYTDNRSDGEIFEDERSDLEELDGTGWDSEDEDDEDDDEDYEDDGESEDVPEEYEEDEGGEELTLSEEEQADRDQFPVEYMSAQLIVNGQPGQQLDENWEHLFQRYHKFLRDKKVENKVKAGPDDNESDIEEDEDDQLSPDLPGAMASHTIRNGFPAGTNMDERPLTDGDNNGFQAGLDQQPADMRDQFDFSQPTEPDNIDFGDPDTFGDIYAFGNPLDAWGDPLDSLNDMPESSYPDPGMLQVNGQNTGVPSPYYPDTAGIDNYQPSAFQNPLADLFPTVPPEYFDSEEFQQIIEDPNLQDGAPAWEQNLYDSMKRNSGQALNQSSNDISMEDQPAWAVDPTLQQEPSSHDPTFTPGGVTYGQDGDIAMDYEYGFYNLSPEGTVGQQAGHAGNNMDMSGLETHYHEDEPQLDRRHGMAGSIIDETRAGPDETMSDNLALPDDVRPSIEIDPTQVQSGAATGKLTPREPQPSIRFESEPETRFPSQPLSDEDREELRARLQTGYSLEEQGNTQLQRSIDEITHRFSGSDQNGHINDEYRQPRTTFTLLPHERIFGQPRPKRIERTASAPGDPDKRNPDDDDDEDDGDSKKPSKDAGPPGHLPHGVNRDPEDEQPDQNAEQMQPQNNSDIIPTGEAIHEGNVAREHPNQLQMQLSGPGEAGNVINPPTTQVSGKVATGGGPGDPDPEHHSSDDDGDPKKKRDEKPKRNPEKISDKDNDPFGRKRLDAGSRRKNQTSDGKLGSGHGRNKATDYLRQAWELRIQQKLTLAMTLLSLFKYIPNKRLKEGASYAHGALRRVQEARDERGIKISLLLQIRCEFYAGWADIVTNIRHTYGDGSPKWPEWLTTDDDEPPSELTKDHFRNVEFLVQDKCCQESIWAKEWIDHFKNSPIVGERIPDFDRDDEEGNNPGYDDESFEGEHSDKGKSQNDTGSEQQEPDSEKEPQNHPSGQQRSNPQNELSFEKNSTLQEKEARHTQLKEKIASLRLPTVKEASLQISNVRDAPSLEKHNHRLGHTKRASWLFLPWRQERSLINQMEEGQSPVRATFAL